MPIIITTSEAIWLAYCKETVQLLIITLTLPTINVMVRVVLVFIDCLLSIIHPFHYVMIAITTAKPARTITNTVVQPAAQLILDIWM